MEKKGQGPVWGKYVFGEASSSNTCKGSGTASAYFFSCRQSKVCRCVCVCWGGLGRSAPHRHSGTQADGGSAVWPLWFPGSPWTLALSEQKREERGRRNDIRDPHHRGNTAPAWGCKGLWEHGPCWGSCLSSRDHMMDEGKGIPCCPLAPQSQGRKRAVWEKNLSAKRPPRSQQ